MIDVELKAGDLVKLKTPDWPKTFGQGEPPKGMKINTGNKDKLLPWGQVFKCSNNCDPDDKISNIDSDYSGTYPLIRIDFVNEHKSQFEIISGE